MRCEFQKPEVPFLSLSSCLVWVSLAEERGVSKVARSPNGFFTAYQDADGKKSNLSCWWRNRRINFCDRHWIQIQTNEDEKLFESSGKFAGLPTRHALALIMWAWHPNPAALSKSVQVLKEYENDRS